MQSFFFWKYFYFCYTTFLHLSTRSSGHHQNFCYSRFFSRKSQSQQRLVKRSFILQYSFAQKTLLILRTWTHFTLKIICSRDTTKKLSPFTNFPANIFLFDVTKNIYTAPFLDGQERQSCSTLKANACIFLYISLRKFLFHRNSKILSGDIGGRGRLNNFLKAARWLDLAKCFTVFHFNWNVQKFNYFWAFPHIALKRWNFPDNLSFKGNTVAKFLMRSRFFSI